MGDIKIAVEEIRKKIRELMNSYYEEAIQSSADKERQLLAVGKVNACWDIEDAIDELADSFIDELVNSLTE